MLACDASDSNLLSGLSTYSTRVPYIQFIDFRRYICPVGYFWKHVYTAQNDKIITGFAIALSH
jgi:hypothetical protein